MAQSVVVKKEIKVNQIFDELGADCSFEEFFEKFKKDYPTDWDRINDVYKAHEQRDTKGKGHPMPKPDQYMKNTYNVGKKKYKSKK